MARDKRSKGDGGRFGRSGNTSHQARREADAVPGGESPPYPPRSNTPSTPPPGDRTRYDPPYDDRGYDPRERYGRDPYEPDRYSRDPYERERYDRYERDRYERDRYERERYDRERYGRDPYDRPNHPPPPDSQRPDPRADLRYDPGYAARYGAGPTEAMLGKAQPTERPTEQYPAAPGPPNGTRELPTGPDGVPLAGAGAAAAAGGGPAGAAGPVGAAGVTGAAGGVGAEGAVGAAGAAAAGADAAAKVTVTRAVGTRGKQAAQAVTRKIVAASEADGAKESGLTQLIWNQVLSYGADAMITVALAGTVFFGATQGEQKGNVLGYLLITMAPFAIVAPIIGPALDRLQHGRRWAMAGASFGRALMAILMAQNFDNLYALFPLALGSLVLSKAYAVVRAAAAPRVVPAQMTLVSANARLSIFGLGSAIIGGGFIALVIKATQSYPFALWVTAIAFCVTGYFALRLPSQVDSAHAATRHPQEPPRPLRTEKVPPTSRIREWAGRGFDPHVIIAMQGAALLRWAAGFLTLFLAFYIQRTSHGLDAAAALGGIGVGVGLGNFAGTAAGARFTFAHPDRLVLTCTAAATFACIFAAATFSLLTSTICMTIASAANSLGKLSLDAVVQRDVSETLRSSAFARSETFLQLAWVFGATVALLLPADKGALGMAIAATFLGVVTLIMVLRTRAISRATQRGPGQPGPGQAPGTV